jgi:pimeloyl-ACP methyl ester carboxylesterase
VTETRTVQLDADLPITLEEAGSGRPALVLHGGGGPGTVAGLVAHLADTLHVLAPTHPGWNGADRPDRIGSIVDLASAYLTLLAVEDLRDVLVVGSSIGGWLAAEMAVGDRERRIGGLVLIDAVGVEIDGEPIRDFFALDARGVAEYTFHDHDRFYVDPATLPAEQTSRQRANMATLRILAGDPYMHDPDLLGRLNGVKVPTLVIWGDSDRIVTPAYGRALTDAIPGAHFANIPDAGHLPHLEQPARTYAVLDPFLAIEDLGPRR